MLYCAPPHLLTSLAILINYSIHNPNLATDLCIFNANLMLQTILMEVQMKPNHNIQTEHLTPPKQFSCVPLTDLMTPFPVQMTSEQLNSSSCK